MRGFIDAQVNQWQNDLHDLLRRVRQRAPSTRVVALNLPNLGAAPAVAGLPVLERNIMQRIAVSLTDRINTLTSQNVMVIDLMCDARSYNSSLFSSDGFHPSDSGYALMAGSPIRCWRATARQARHPPVLNGPCCPFSRFQPRSGSSATVASAFRRDPGGRSSSG